MLPQAEFAYDRSNHGSTGKSPFFVVYGRNPFTPLNLTPCPGSDHFNAEGETQEKQIQELHMQVREHIIKHNMQYQHQENQHRKHMVFNEGGLLWIHLRKERFPGGHFRKLRPRGDGPFIVLKRINDNAYKIELPGHYNVSATFNVGDLTPYVPTGNDVVTDLRSSPFYVEEDNADTDHEHIDMGLPHIDSLDDFNDIRGLVRDALGVNSLDLKRKESSESRLERDIDEDIEGYIEEESEEDIEEESEEDIEEEINEDSKEDIGDKDIQYKKLLEECENELYPGSKIKKDGKLRHPADGLAWKAFNAQYPKFASDPRSVRIGLASDRFNPFRTIPYHLPLWICMKQKSLILSSIILGRKAPGDDIDIYLIPLINELKLWLEPNHNYRSQMDHFDGTIETESPSSVLTGSDILKQLRGTTFKYGKYDKSSKKRTRDAIECSDDKCSAFGDKDDLIEENIERQNSVDPFNIDGCIQLNGKSYVHNKAQPEGSIAEGRFYNEQQSLRNEQMSLNTMEKLFVEKFSWWLKQQSYVRNKAQPEGSIAEGYIKEECLTFCARYFEDVETFMNCPRRNDGIIRTKEMYMLNSGGRKLGKVEIVKLDGTLFAQAHCYVLLNHPKIQPLRVPFIHTGESLKDDPFIIASQAQQVFYIEDPKDVGWWHIIMTKPRDTYDMGRNVNMDEDDDDDEELYTECMPYNLPIPDAFNETPSWRRTDIEIENE
uniref:RNA-directed DNA polymerase n=1 Tax=Tanacetum cinerariifolium TaxID=118510 RepID=A0A6L2JLH2_TANCI|nr:RNA-directed DNA polymerase [Tanacetum cinerariifolium]